MPNNMWREMYDFSPEAVLMVLASEIYREEDYIRDYDVFLRSVEEGGSDACAIPGSGADT